LSVKIVFKNSDDAGCEPSADGYHPRQNDPKNFAKNNERVRDSFPNISFHLYDDPGNLALGSLICMVR